MTCAVRYKPSFIGMYSVLAPLLAKGYRISDQPPLGFFETINMAPSWQAIGDRDGYGSLHPRVMNGSALDGVRILPKARLDEMMAPDAGEAPPPPSPTTQAQPGFIIRAGALSEDQLLCTTCHERMGFEKAASSGRAGERDLFHCVPNPDRICG